MGEHFRLSLPNPYAEPVVHNFTELSGHCPEAACKKISGKYDIVCGISSVEHIVTAAAVIDVKTLSTPI
jgi:hypothetical protein